MLDFMAHLSIFFHHQLIFDVSGKWPVPARGHGRNGYREFLSEALGISDQEFPRFVPLLLDRARVAYLPCPCGSGKQAKRCHLIVVNKLISTIGLARLRDQVSWINEVTWSDNPASSDTPKPEDGSPSFLSAEPSTPMQDTIRGTREPQ
jgi:hypothetical protein